MKILIWIITGLVLSISIGQESEPIAGIILVICLIIAGIKSLKELSKPLN